MTDQSGSTYNPVTGDLPHNGVETSVEAAVSMKVPASTMRARITEWIKTKQLNGATCDEVEIALNFTHQSCSARVKELFDGGHIIKTQDKRKTRSGRNAMVYVHKDYAGQLNLLGDAA